MRHGTSAYGEWVRLENCDEASAEANGLWWITFIDPDNVEQGCYGGGNTLAEAAAVAWITCICLVVGIRP